MNAVETIKKKLEGISSKLQGHNSWQSRYDRLKNSDYNKKARKSFEKMLSKTYAEMQLTEAQEAILFSQAYHQLLLKNPATSKFPDFDEYDVEKTEATYIIKGFCDSTNSYGAQIREKHEYEVHKGNNEWTCITDVRAKLIKWILIGILLILLPTIVTCCSISAM